MEKKIMAGILFLVIGTLLGVSSIASAHGWFGIGTQPTQEDLAAMQEQRQAMENAIANNDFAAWKSLMEDQIAKMQSQLTEENFQSIVIQHQKMEEFRSVMKDAKESGDYSKVKDFAEENEINFGRMHNPGGNMGKSFGFR